jgi:hypothetical protein
MPLSTASYSRLFLTKPTPAWAFSMALAVQRQAERHYPKANKIVFLIYFSCAAGDDACMKSIPCHGHC